MANQAAPTTTTVKPGLYEYVLQSQKILLLVLYAQSIDGPIHAIRIERHDRLNVALELGGAPADVANLWPEPWTGDANAHMKDAVENYLRAEVCRGAMQLVEARRQIATDWLAVYRSRGLQPTP